MAGVSEPSPGDGSGPVARLNVAAAKVGLVVNPIAGMGGPIGLKGSDGWDREELERMGGEAHASARATLALLRLPGGVRMVVHCAAGAMGADAVRDAGLQPEVVYTPMGDETGPEDTVRACRALAAAGCGLILFSGGDGTARDVHRAIGQTVAALGIPAGVKIHSGAFAASPTVAGEVAATVMAGQTRTTLEAEVVDLDEAEYRAGRIAVRLFGYLAVPNRPASLQGSKVRSVGDEDAIAGIGRALADGLQPGADYLVGPGSTAKSVLRALDVPFTLLGVDLLRDGRSVVPDLSAAGIMACIDGGPIRMIVSPIGGQGYIFGRGNQPLSPEVIRRVGKDNLVVAATARKLASMHGRPLRVDTGDQELDQSFAGYIHVLTGRDHTTIYPVTC